MLTRSQRMSKQVHYLGPSVLFFRFTLERDSPLARARGYIGADFGEGEGEFSQWWMPAKLGRKVIYNAALCHATMPALHNFLSIRRYNVACPFRDDKLRGDTVDRGYSIVRRIRVAISELYSHLWGLEYLASLLVMHSPVCSNLPSGLIIRFRNRAQPKTSTRRRDTRARCNWGNFIMQTTTHS